MRKTFLEVIVLGLASFGSAKNTTSITLDKFMVDILIRFNSEEIKKHYPDANVFEVIGVFEVGTEELPYERFSSWSFK